MNDYVPALLVAGLVAGDTTSGPQILLSEPLVSCTLAGLIFGAPETGLLLGVLFQLFIFGYMPLGAVRFFDGNMASYTAAVSLFAAGDLLGFTTMELRAGIIPALLISVPAGVVGRWMTTKLRHYHNRLSERLVERLEAGEPASPTAWHLAGIGRYYLRGIVMLLIVAPAGVMLCTTVRMVPEMAIVVMAHGVHLMFGTMAAAAVFVFWRKRKRWSLVGGAIGGILWVTLYILGV